MRKLDRPSRFRMLARRQKRLVRPALLLLPAVALAGVGTLAVRGAVEQAGTGSWIRHAVGLALPIRRIVVAGEHLTTEGDIIGALKLRIGSPIMQFSPAEAEARVEALPFVETADVERRLPGTVLVSVVERTPYAVWQDRGRFVLIDRTGKVVAGQGLDGKDAQAFARLPLVVGDGAPAGAGALIDTLDTAPKLRAATVAAVRVGDRRWNLELRNGCQVLLPEAAEAPAIARLAALEDQYRLLERPLATIDMRLPDRLVLRPDAMPVADGAAAANEGAQRGSTPGGKTGTAKPDAAAASARDHA